MNVQVRNWLRGITLGLIVAGLLTPLAYADSLTVVVQRVDVSQFPNIRSYVSIASASGVPVTGLDAQSLVIQEDGKAVDNLVINASADMQEPIVTAIVIDVSDSMGTNNYLDAVRTAASAYVDALGPNDRTTVVSFGSRVTQVQDYTSDKSALKSALDSLAARGSSLLYDAIDQTAGKQAGQAEGRRPVILVTDGTDATSSASLGTAIASAQSAGSPIYTIGLGPNVDKNVLGQIAQSTGGVAAFVSDPSALKATFLSIDDFLRREYVLRYTSKLSPDTTQHGLVVQATYQGQQASGLKSFTIPTRAPAAVTIGGLTSGATVSGIQHVTVDVAGGAQTVQLLVDNQSSADLTAHSVPAAFDWNTSADTPGPHQIVVRVTDAQGIPNDSPFAINVAPPAPVAATAVPTPAPTPCPTLGCESPSNVSSLLIGLILVLLLIIASVWFILRGRGSAPAPVKVVEPSPPQATRVREDLTDIVGARPEGMTMVRPNRERTPPQIRLAIVRQGQQRDFATRELPITLGRARDRATVPIEDPLISSEHVRIRRDGAQFYVEDLRSKNGTQLNGEPIAPETPRLLKSNDRIFMGDTVVTFVVDAR